MGYARGIIIGSLKRYFFPILLAACAAWLAGCSPKPAEAVRKPVTPVTIATVTQRTVPVEVRAIGNVEAYSTISVKSQVGGYLTHVYFKEGDEVHKGELIFQIDPRPAEEQVKQLEANLARDTAQAKNAEADAERYGALFRQGIISKQQYEGVHTNADALNAAIRADQAAIDNAKLQVEYCAIRSPVTGRTGNLMVKEGNLVKANDVPLVTINQIRPIYATFSVPEQELPQIRKFMAARPLPVEASMPQGDKLTSRGTLSFIDNSVDSTTGTIKLKATFPNDDHRLWPGQFVNVVLTVSSRPNATLVPSQAVQTGQQGQFVYVVKADQSAQMRPVVIGRQLANATVIESGLQPGETVVTDGQSRLVPGAKVQIVKGVNNESGGSGL